MLLKIRQQKWYKKSTNIESLQQQKSSVMKREWYEMKKKNTDFPSYCGQLYLKLQARLDKGAVMA